MDHLDAKIDFGAVGDGVSDDTIPIQSMINDARGIPIYIPPGNYRTTKPITPNPNGTDIYGASDNGRFTTILKPENCRAIDLDGMHHTSIKNLVIWPTGNLPPDAYIYYRNTYSIKLDNIRIHLASGQFPCTDAAILVDTSNNNAVLNNIIVRSDGSYYPSALRFMPTCGTLNLSNPDIETCGTGIVWEGGTISISNPYSERMGASFLKSIVDPGTAQASLCIHGGIVTANASGIPLQLYKSVKNLTMHGVTITAPQSSYEAYLYSGATWINSSLHGCLFNLNKWNFFPTAYN